MPITNALFNYPKPTKERNQRSIDIDDLYLYRLSPPWSRPSTLPANTWRQWVLNQPVAMVCRETLIATLLSLDWKITPRNSKYQEELESTIKYYTKLLTRGGDYGALQLDYSGLIEWIAGDLLDTPFGGAAEIGRRGNEPGGRVAWIRPLDSATLYPTLNGDFPAVQYYMQYEAVAFPKGFIARTYMSPHSMIWREGWGMAPPEKIYFAVEMLNRGDKYYSNLLLDIPTAGILDLGDMEKSAAEEWITAFKTFVADTSQSFRVPVLYEHNNKIEFIPFGKVPNDIMFDRISLKYAALTSAAYGMSLSDIGLQTTSASGETLAGSIRQERKTKKTGHARVKAKIKAFFDQILPDTLEFNFIDYDDELNVALGRARLASSQAFTTWMNDGVLAPLEVRQQIIQDGLMSVAIPDEIPPEAKPMTPAERTIRYIGKGEKQPGTPGNKEPELLQGGKAPSMGGEGEIKSLVDSVSFKAKSRNLNNFVDSLVADFVPKLIDTLSAVSEDELDVMKSMVSDSVLDETDSLMLSKIITNIVQNRSLGTFQFGDLEKEFERILGDDYPTVNIKNLIHTFKSRLQSNLADFIGRAVIITALHSDVNSETILDDVRTTILRTLPEYLSAFVSIEVQNALDGAKSLPLSVPEAIKVKSLSIRKKDTAPTPISVNPSIQITMPERETKIDVQVPERPAPIVNVSLPASEPNITVNLPEQEPPDVFVEPAQVHLSVPEQSVPNVIVNVPQGPAPVVNVDVEPTPVEVKNTVNVPAPKKQKREITIKKDGNNVWHGEAE